MDYVKIKDLKGKVYILNMDNVISVSPACKGKATCFTARDDLIFYADVPFDVVANDLFDDDDDDDDDSDDDKDNPPPDGGGGRSISLEMFRFLQGNRR